VAQVERLEREIDHYNGPLPRSTASSCRGGSAAAAAIHSRARH